MCSLLRGAAPLRTRESKPMSSVLAVALVLSGPVVAVADGDSLTILADGARVQVRIHGIDAPEANQPYSKRARQALTELCYRHTATVFKREADRIGRVVGDVECSGRDAASYQVRNGYAWVYAKHVAKNSTLHRLENEARAAKRGLWAGDPMPPWEWRKRKR